MQIYVLIYKCLKFILKRNKKNEKQTSLSVSIGTIKLKMYGDTISTIQEVRHVKGLKKNLLPKGQLDGSWCKMHVQDGIMKIVKGIHVVLTMNKI